MGDRAQRSEDIRDFMARIGECVDMWKHEEASPSQQQMFEDSQIYYKDDSIWWQGYHQQQSVIVKEFSGKLPIESLLNLIDGVPHNVQIKNGHVQFTSERMIVTSVKDPRYWYDFSSNYMASVRGRVPSASYAVYSGQVDSLFSNRMDLVIDTNPVPAEVRVFNSFISMILLGRIVHLLSHLGGCIVFPDPHNYVRYRSLYELSRKWRMVRIFRRYELRHRNRVADYPGESPHEGEEVSGSRSREEAENGEVGRGGLEEVEGEGNDMDYVGRQGPLAYTEEDLDLNGVGEFSTDDIRLEILVATSVKSYERVNDSLLVRESQVPDEELANSGFVYGVSDSLGEMRFNNTKVCDI